MKLFKSYKRKASKVILFRTLVFRPGCISEPLKQLIKDKVSLIPTLDDSVNLQWFLGLWEFVLF